MLVLLLLACRDPAPDKGAADTAADTAAAAPDTAAPGPAETPIRFLLPEALSGAVLTLEQHDPVTAALLGGYASAPIDGDTVELSLPPPDPADMYWLDDEGYPGAGVAIYHAAVHADLDGDGAHSPGEPYLGVGAHRPLYVAFDAAVPPNWAELGLSRGWNVLRERELLLDPNLVDPQNVPLALNLSLTETLSIQGPGGDGHEDVLLALLPYQTLSGAAEAPAIYTAPWTDEAWSVDLSGAPAAETFYAWLEGYAYALVMPTLLRDNDGSGDASEGDERVASACLDGLPAGVLWLPQPTDAATAVSFATQDITMGWSPIVIKDGAVALIEPGAEFLLTGGCLQ